MKYKPFKKPKIMQAKVQTKYGKSIDHPQIVLGRAGKEYVSVSCTHSSHVKGKHVHRMNKNIEDAYMVDNVVYHGLPSKYKPFKDNRTRSLSTKDWRQARRVAIKGKPERIK